MEREEKKEILIKAHKWQLDKNCPIESLEDINQIEPDLASKVRELWPGGLGSFLNDLARFGLESLQYSSSE